MLWKGFRYFILSSSCSSFEVVGVLLAGIPLGRPPGFLEFGSGNPWACLNFVRGMGCSVVVVHDVDSFVLY